MNATTEHCHLDNELTLRDRSESPLTVRAVNLTLTKQDDAVSECRLTFQLSTELYQRIDTEALFNLKPELRGPTSPGGFLPEPDIEIEASLQPDLLPQLIKHAANPEEAAAHLQSVSQEQPNHPLVATESWFGLHVKQPQESGTTGYRTFWAHVSQSVITQEITSRGQISKAMINFFKDWADADMSALTEEAISETFEEMLKAFEELAQTSVLAITEEAISEIFEEVTNVFEEWVDSSLSAINQDAPPRGQIFEAIVNFFLEDDWPFAKIKGEPVLRLAFQGEHGKWTCYARARVEQEQFVFYSVCPVKVPENKRVAIAEFLTRANSGMIIGNFELNFADGEIRYKTSINVKGDFLSSDALKQLVYTNVMIMDKYLPGTMNVIDDDVSPVDAIAQIEG